MCIRNFCFYVFLCDITYPRSVHAHPYAVKIVDNKYNVSIKTNVQTSVKWTNGFVWDKFNLTFIAFVFLIFLKWYSKNVIYYFAIRFSYRTCRFEYVCLKQDIIIHIVYKIIFSPVVNYVLIKLKLHYILRGSETCLLLTSILFLFCTVMLDWWELNTIFENIVFLFLINEI